MIAPVPDATAGRRDSQAGALTTAPDSYPGYELVWADEFARDGEPDPANWTYEQGFVRNQEDPGPRCAADRGSRPLTSSRTAAE
ncbi:MAG: hypothetical protein ABI818_19575 [Acidobacteriota bacterium]